MRNVVIAGRFATGKSTLANLLVGMYGYQRGSFAFRLKELAREVYGEGGEPIDKMGSYRVTSLDGEPADISGRELLQQLGQTVKPMDRDFWLRWFVKDIANMEGPFVVDDCRFPFEADFLRQRGWLVVKLYAPDEVRAERYRSLYGRVPTSAEMNHESETQVDLIRPHLQLDATEDPVFNASWILQTAQNDELFELVA